MIIFFSQDLTNQLKKVNGEMKERESALEQQYQEMLEQTKRKLHSHEATIQRLTTTLADKEQQLQVTQYMFNQKISLIFFFFKSPLEH